MSKAGSTFLDVNDPFPEMTVKTVSGKVLQLPEEFGKGYGVILFYRGYW